jgi:hypothetical protein
MGIYSTETSQISILEDKLVAASLENAHLV